MGHNSFPLDADLEEFIREQLGTHSKTKGTPRYDDELTSALTESMSEAVARFVSHASPLERILFLQALAPAIADALAPALAKAMAPTLVSALSSMIAPKPKAEEAGSGSEGARKPDGKK